MKRRVWATVLALCMVVGILPPGTAWADVGFFMMKEPSAASPTILMTTLNGWNIEYYYPSSYDAHYELSGGNGVVICHASGNTASYDIPNQIDGQPVVGLVALGVYGLGVEGASDTVFGDCAQLTSITIPNSVTHIIGAFYGCSNLTSVTIPNSVTYIGKGAFWRCNALTNVTIPDNVTYIGEAAFCWCRNLTDANIPSNVTTIGRGAFFLTALTDVTLPDGITSIEGEAFAHGRNLTSINLPDSLTSIGYEAFFGCSKLTSITIPNRVTSIESHTFAACGLTSITIPTNITSIKQYAFSTCESLTSVDIPSSVTSIGKGAFNYCTNLTSITIPNSVSNIEDCTFLKCTSLTSIDIPDSVSNIGQCAFAGCEKLTSITIPQSVTSIDTAAFGSCSKLNTVYYGGSEAYRNANLQIDNTEGMALIPYYTKMDNQYLLNANWVYTNNNEESASCRVDFFPNGGTITSIRGYDRSAIYPGSDLAQEQDIFVDTYSGIGMIMSDKTGQLDCLPVIAREGYTFDGWWYTDNQDVINSAYDREVTDFTGMQRVDLSTNFVRLADSPASIRSVIAKWNKNSDETDNTHEVWFHLNGGTVTSVLGISTSHMVYGSLYDSAGNWIYAEAPDDNPSETLGVMITDKSGKLAGLPVIERAGYTFDGWYTMENGGNKITEGYTFTGAGQYGRDYLWAQWVPSTDQPGDLTGDGKITMADVIRLARGAAGYATLTEQEQKAGDVTGDGKITMADVIRIARYAAGYSSTL